MSTDTPHLSDSESEPSEQVPRKTLPTAVRYLLLIAVLLCFAYWLYLRFTHIYTDDARVAADMVTVSSQVSGQVRSMSIRQGDSLVVGSVIATLDSRDAILRQGELQAELERLRANHERELLAIKLVESQTDSQLEVVSAKRSAAVAALSGANSEKDLMSSSWVRTQTLKEKKLVSDQIWEASRSNHQRANEASKKAAAELATVNAQQHEAQANRQRMDVMRQGLQVLALQIKQKQLELERQDIEVSDRTVLSAVPGVVDKTFVDAGEYLRAGQRVALLHNPEKVWIDANIRETEINDVSVGAAVRVDVDAYPDMELHGTVERIGNAATSQYALLPNANPSGNFTKVTQRIPIRIAVSQQQAMLKPGMMVEIAIER